MQDILENHLRIAERRNNNVPLGANGKPLPGHRYLSFDMYADTGDNQPVNLGLNRTIDVQRVRDEISECRAAGNPRIILLCYEGLEYATKPFKAIHFDLQDDGETYMVWEQAYQQPASNTGYGYGMPGGYRSSGAAPAPQSSTSVDELVEAKVSAATMQIYSEFERRMMDLTAAVERQRLEDENRRLRQYLRRMKDKHAAEKEQGLGGVSTSKLVDNATQIGLALIPLLAAKMGVQMPATQAAQTTADTGFADIPDVPILDDDDDDDEYEHFNDQNDEYHEDNTNEADTKRAVAEEGRNQNHSAGSGDHTGDGQRVAITGDGFVAGGNHRDGRTDSVESQPDESGEEPDKRRRSRARRS